MMIVPSVISIVVVIVVAATDVIIVGILRLQQMSVEVIFEVVRWLDSG